ncbi:MAG: hypothetical protein DGJ47_000659 [Rickettsiaceae bacterium]
MKNYNNLEKKLQQIGHLNTIYGVAHWDKSVSLASGSMQNRAEELASVSALIHEMSTSQEMGDLINSAYEDKDSLNKWQKKNLELAQKNYDTQTCLPVDLQREFNIATSQSEFAWREARQNNNFSKVAPYLEKLFSLTRKKSKILSEKLGLRPYDALIDQFDPGRRSPEIDVVFSGLKEKLIPLAQKIQEKQKSEEVLPLPNIDVATQRQISLQIVESMGFDLNCGRLHETLHPFCSGSNDDVRLTTSFDETRPLFGLFATIHETGHGLYQQSLPARYRDQPVGKPLGMAFHESQSLIMERQAATSKPFVEFLSRLLQDKFGFKGNAFGFDNLYKLLTRVESSLIRITSDEVTYPLHIILRYELEKVILDDNFQINDLPELWNSKMKEYLGITPDTDSDGCMQDIHWYMGAFGYFPAYTNGALVASMMMQQIRQKNTNIDNELVQGSFVGINQYLNQNIRSLGSLLNSSELLEKATGSKIIDPQIFIDYLKEKYL